MHRPQRVESIALLAKTDASRKVANGELNTETKALFGQYMTPTAVASFMASLFPPPNGRKIRLLDPGAGVGSLASAFVANLTELPNLLDKIEVDAYEIDPVMKPYLVNNLELCKSTAGQRGRDLSWRILTEDFIIDAVEKISSNEGLWHNKIDKYTHCILNPPYKKILSTSRHRRYLRSVGIETVNLYSAFVALSLYLMESNGYLVAIIPRSFCNGPYYRPFRDFVLKHSAIRHIHLFASRNKAFKDDNVLQENIVIMLERNADQGEVTVSTSTDDRFADIRTTVYPFNQIVQPDDRERFVHIPLSSVNLILNYSKTIRYSLEEIGIHVSTGPVVDFRLKEHLRMTPENGTIPLLYPSHFSRLSTVWPILKGKKPNAILCNRATRKLLYPIGYYTVVRRFSSKEEKRRIIASIVEPTVFQEAKLLGFENHLNVFHVDKRGLPESLARGLAIFLNSTAVDCHFRRFSGHTQVNATDLRLMKYPSRDVLISLGKWANLHNEITQDLIDDQVKRIIG